MTEKEREREPKDAEEIARGCNREERRRREDKILVIKLFLSAN